MNLQEFNDYISVNWDNMCQKAFALNRGKHKLSSEHIDDLCQEAYIHIRERIDKISKPYEIRTYFNTFVYHQLNWPNSDFHRNIKDVKRLDDRQKSLLMQAQVENNTDIEIKINIEKWYTEKKGLLELFKLQIDRKERNLLDLYIKHGAQMGYIQKIADHLHISRYGTNEMLKSLQSKLTKFVDELQPKI